MKIKNENQYKIQKSQGGGRNNAYKNFTSRVEEGCNPNKTSYVELFMNNMKIKNNFCNWLQYETQRNREGGRNNAYKIFTAQVEEGYTPNTTSYVEDFMTAMKMKNHFCDRFQYEMQ